MKKILLIIFFFPVACIAQNKPTVQQQVWAITGVMYHDVVNPPAAARFYAYSVLTGYEIVSQLDHHAFHFQDKLNQYPAVNISAYPSKIDIQFAAMYGMLETGKNIIPSGYLLEERQQLLKTWFQKRISKSILDSSIAFAKKVSGIIVQYSKTDGYFKLSTLPRYRPIVSDSTWQPTAPAYMAAVEPHWQTIRMFFNDDEPVMPAVSFSSDSSSSFFHLVNEVYTTANHLTEEQKKIANFWDCNPFALQFEGHMDIGLKKISPGGHWMGIAGIACKKINLDFARTMLVHTLVALTLHDAFICCWKEKYKSNRIRPETAINRYIDQKWKPLLQTPPFPEYVSGHSVISTAAAEVLSALLGDHVSFTDDTETYIGLPARKFSSFREAAAEARISRLYGGIHFRDAIENGGTQGGALGKAIVKLVGVELYSSGHW